MRDDTTKGKAPGLENVDPDAFTFSLAAHYFKNDIGEPFLLYPYQVPLVRNILYGEHKRTLCWATTRAGKSLSVALGIILKAHFNPGRKIRIIAPTVDHTKIIMGYVIQHILDHIEIKNSLMFDTKGMGVDRIRKELTKQHIQWRNGSDIMILTANILGEGRTLLGHGGTDLVVDEGELIPANIINTRIMRMLGDSPDATAFFIANPVRRGFMFDMKKNPRWHQEHINWEDCVASGRLSQDFIDERRESLSSIEFDIWYNAIYPDAGEDSLIPWSLIEHAYLNYPSAPPELKKSIRCLGVDVASMGSDLTVYTDTEIQPNGNRIIRDIEHTSKKTTMETAGMVQAKDKLRHYTYINIDMTGLGTGVVDRLKERPQIAERVNGIHNAQTPSTDDAKERYSNAKAEMYFLGRKLFEVKRIYIPHHNILTDQLSKMRFDYTSVGKFKIVDPDEKSPDFADSLMLSIYPMQGTGFAMSEIAY